LHRPAYIVAESGTDGIRSLRALLKVALRRLGLRAIDVRELDQRALDNHHERIRGQKKGLAHRASHRRARFDRATLLAMTQPAKQ